MFNIEKYKQLDNDCDKGYCKVGSIIYAESNDDIIQSSNEIERYESFIEMFNNGGHVNYALHAYCVEIGHINCLKKISKEPNLLFIMIYQY
jgi:hypothetical protein